MATATAKPKATIAEALVDFQADLPKVVKDRTNPAFKSKYATLDAVTDSVIPALNKHGLSFTVGSFVDNGLLIVDAHLLHVSGESRSLQFPVTETNPQKIGSAITYARRYALTSLTGVVADEDDDGNAASAGPTAQERSIQAAKEGRKPTAPVNPTEDKAKAEIRALIESGAITKTMANDAAASNKDGDKTDWNKTLADLKAAAS